MLERQLQKNNIKLNETVIESIKKLSFTTFTPVQVKAIPVFLQNYDLAVHAVTGSGKTLAYVIPIIERLLKLPSKINKYDIFSLVIVPTRELAVQVYKVFTHFLEQLPFSLCQLVGGQSVKDSIKEFTTNGGNVTVCTPGRAEAFLKQKHDSFDFASCLERLEVLIIDEADRLLADGYKSNIETILRYLPKQRRTGIFSATLNDEITSLMKFGMRNPKIVSLHSSSTPSKLNNYYRYCTPLDKVNFAHNFIKHYRHSKIIVFFATCAETSYFHRVFSRLSPEIQLFCLHRKQRGKRDSIYSQFVSAESGVLLCTDIVARGVDVPDVDWVLQFDPPKMASSFIHRCGRTARMGKKGQALILLNHHEEAYVDFLEINQQVVLEEFDEDFGEVNLNGDLRQLSEMEREFMEKGVLAFVSYIKAYLKHPLRQLFDLSKLPVGSLAQSFGLLKIPRIVEIRGNDVSSFTPSEVDVDSVQYKEARRETERKRMAGDNLAKKEAKRRLNAKYAKRRKMLKTKRSEYVRSDRLLDDDDLDDIEEDCSLLKKLRSGKMSKGAFEARFLK